MTPPVSYDLIIIGSGPGGYQAAVRAARAGLQVAIVERSHPGGTCLNEGCIPTKALCRSAEVAATLREAESFGIRGAAQDITADLPQIISRKEQIIEGLRAAIDALLATPGITRYTATASFADAHTLCLDDPTPTSTDGATRITAPHIIIATGSESKSLPVPGVGLPGVMDARALLQSTVMPRRLCVIGGGVIGLEFASIFHQLGCSVAVVEYAPEVLPRFDKDIAKRLRTALKRSGIEFHLSAAVTGIESSPEDKDGPLQVRFTQKGGKEGSVTADRVLMAVGRGARISELHLDAAGIVATPRGITVDENMQTNVPGVYAVGDCNGLCQLAHAATYQSFRSLHHILGETDSIDFNIMPAAVFTHPELATVGLTEEECRERGLQVEVVKTPYRSNGKALAEGCSDGILKQIYETGSGRLLGCHILGSHAADLIHQAAMQMATQTSRQTAADMILAHPTLSELYH